MQRRQLFWLSIAEFFDKMAMATIFDRDYWSYYCIDIPFKMFFMQDFKIFDYHFKG